MAKDDNQTLRPKLRFPAFQSERGWDERPLKDVCEVNPASGDLPDSFIYIDLESVEGGVLNSRKKIAKKNAPSRAQRFLKNGDVVFQIVRPYQRNNLFVQFNDDETYVASTGYAQLRAHDIDSFLYQVVHTDPFVDRVIEKCTGSSYPAINSTDLAEVLVPVPPRTDEQRKIADCLTSLDEVIAAQGRKVEALKAHKKSLMQQLFPREGETLPRLRFPEFRQSLGWEKRRLGEFIRERSEIAVETVPLFSLTIEDGITAKTDRYERSFLVTNKKDAYKLVLPNDFAFNPMNLRFGAIGRHSGSAAVALSKYYNIFHCDESVVPSFCEIYFRSDGMVAYYDVMATGTLIEKRRVHFDRFLNFIIPFPQKDEQQQIADCFATLDARIAAETQKLATLKTHKRGLMQQLFPSPEAK